MYVIKAMVEQCLIPRAKKIGPPGHAIDKVFILWFNYKSGICSILKHNFSFFKEATQKLFLSSGFTG